jgi:hypothetical protein
MRHLAGMGDGKADEWLDRASADLKALGALRLWKACGTVSSAQAYLQEIPAPQPYADETGWARAKRRALRVIRDFEGHIPITARGGFIPGTCQT